MKKIKKNLRKAQTFYETKTAPFLVTFLPWLFWPFYKLCKLLDICFIVNIADGVGHTIPELDNFLRMVKLQEIPPIKYVWIQKKTDFSNTCIRLYKKNFWLALSNNFFYDLFYPLMIKYKDITIDCGLSRLKWQLPEPNLQNIIEPITGNNYLYQLSKKDGIPPWINYQKRKQKSLQFFPLKISTFYKTPNCFELLLKRNKKIALLQIKTKSLNATAQITDPETYESSIIFLKKLNYELVFVGREKMPELFKKHQVFNYAESQDANFYNDIFLFSHADIALCSGSGLAYLACCWNVPLLYVNSWHIALPPPSSKSIFVPSIVRKPKGKFLSFLEQEALYNNLPDHGAEIFPSEKYQARNASEDEIKEALGELLSLQKQWTPFSSLQVSFQKQFSENSLVYNSDVRVSEYFIKKHQELFFSC